MAGVRDIRRRIRSIKNTQQITKAMKMMAAAKLRKAQEKVVAARPYSRQLQDVLARLAQAADARHPLLEQREVKTIAYVVVTADRGLCGGYNANIIRTTSQAIAEANVPIQMVAVGSKARDFFRRRGANITSEYVALGDNPSFVQASEIAKEIVRLYTEREVDEVRLIYTEFISAISQRPVHVKLLPLKAPKQEAKTKGIYLFEPSAEGILESLLPKYVETLVFRALLEAKASELGAKMTAMGAATDAAKDMIERYTLQMNRARQAAITKEISEIVGGIAALE
ncbi:MAG TPA: ATP synthase F1 subunit gamma [Candidatus Deferrimicrobium sp.]|nr:ATP synthase F1 subunit gamma [Candidatus Deferrimicrobium sp.]